MNILQRSISFLKGIIESYTQPKAKETKRTMNFRTNYSSLAGFISILSNNGYKNVKDNWEVWFPNGYNKINQQLEDLELKNTKATIFAIPNCDNLVSKYNLWKSIEEKLGRKEATKLVPETYLLDKEDDVNLLEDGKTYILKKKVQRKEGLKITSKVKDELKGEHDYKVAQKLIKPFLVNGRKVNLRVYFLLQLHKGKIKIHVSNHTTCIYTKDKWDENSQSFETNVTSYNMSLNVYKKNPQSLEQFKTYLNDNGYDYNIFDKLKETIHTVVETIKPQLGNDKYYNNKCVQLFGADFIIDENLNPLLLECNKGPDMKAKSNSIDSPEELTDIITKKIEELKESLNSGITNESITTIKNACDKIHKGYPKYLTNEELIERVEKFYKQEKELKSYPKGYISGNGLKVQKDTMSVLGLIDEKENSFEII